jgi:hypothetical protein
MNQKKTDQNLNRSKLYDSDLFDNPMSRAALKSLSPEDLERYKYIGEQLYTKIDYDKSKVVDVDTPATFDETVLYIEVGLRSGLLPEHLSDDEKRIMYEKYGEDWINRYKTDQ